MRTTNWTLSTTIALAMAMLSVSASGESLVVESGLSGDLRGLNPPTLRGREINPQDPWKGRDRRVWAGALDIYRKWEATQGIPATTNANQPKPVPLPSAALGGLALLGGVGSARAMRRTHDA